MYVHRRCKPSEAELDLEKRVGGFCGICGQEGTVYHIVDTDDYYEYILDGVLYKVRDGKPTNTRAEVRAKLKAEYERVKERRGRQRHNDESPPYEAVDVRERKDVLINDVVAEVDESIPPEPICEDCGNSEFACVCNPPKVEAEEVDEKQAEIDALKAQLEELEEK